MQSLIPNTDNIFEETSGVTARNERHSETTTGCMQSLIPNMDNIFEETNDATARHERNS